jgi:uncharacterized protein with PIN domain
MRVTWSVVFLVLLADLTARAGPGGNPVQPLAGIGKHATDAVAALRAGKPAKEAFAPWLADAKEEERAGRLSKAIEGAGVGTMSTRMLMSWTTYLTRDGRPVYSISADVWFDEKGASLLAVTGSADETDLEMAEVQGAVPVSTLTGDAQPLADAALGLKIALSAEGGKNLTWADLDAVAKQVPNDEVQRSTLAQAKESRSKMESVGKAVVASGATGMLVAPGSLALLGHDKDGRTTAYLVLGLKALPDGKLGWRYEVFTPVGAGKREEKPADDDDDDDDDEMEDDED